MLETVLDYLHNWFFVDGAARRDTFRIVSGALDADFLKSGQYYKIEGSIFNDGLHQHPDGALIDETFLGTVSPMAVPTAVIKLTDEINAYHAQNPETDKISESFGGYSYTRGTDGSGNSSGGWQTAFAARLNRWKKVGG